jgi:signal transduction histidine kinase
MTVVTASAEDSPSPERLALRRQLRTRRVVDRTGRIVLVIVLLLTAAVYVAMPLQAVLWMRTPFIGAMLTASGRVNELQPATAVAWSGLEAGLREGNRITAIDGQSVVTSQDLYGVLSAHQVGDDVRLEVQTDGDTRSLNVRLMRLPPGDIVARFAMPYLIGLLYLALGLWVFRNRREDVASRAFASMCAAVGLVLVTVFDVWATHRFLYVWTAAIPWAAASAMTLALVFPDEFPFVSRYPYLRWVPFALAASIIAFSEMQLDIQNEAFVQIWQQEYYFAGAGALFLIGMMLYRGIATPSPIAREQSRVVMAGAGLSFIPLLAWVVAPPAIPPEVVLCSFLFFPLSIAYALTRYRLLDSERMLGYAAVYTLMGAAVAVGYSLLVAGASLIFGSVVSATNPILIAVTMFVVALVLQPVRGWAQHMVDDLFFHSRHASQQRLDSFRHDLTMAGDLGNVVCGLKEHIRETLAPTHVYVFLRSPEANEFKAYSDGGQPDTDLRFESDSALVHTLGSSRDVIYLEPGRPLPPELMSEQARLAVLRASVLASLRGQERLAGWIAIGPKRSGEPFTMQDLRFVEGMAEQAALAVERAQVVGDLERRVRELDVLSQVSQAVNFTVDLDMLMELIYTQASKVVDTTNFYIVLYDPAQHRLEYAFFLEGNKRITSQEGKGWPDDEGLTGEVVRTGRPICTDHYTAECAARGVQPRQPDRQAWMGVPLNVGANTLGALVVASFQPGGTFIDEQLKVLWAIADQAAMALDKARLFRETEQRARQLAALYQVGSRLTSTLDLQDLLGLITDSAVDILEAEAGSLLLVDEATGDLVFHVTVGPVAGDLVGTRLPAGTGVVGLVADQGKPVIIDDVTKDQRWYRGVDEETAFQTRAILAVPLMIQDKVIGVLEVINKRDGSTFSQDDVALLTTFSAQAAVAIENVRLFQMTDRALAERVDELSVLQRIDRELNRALNVERTIVITLEWAMRRSGACAGAVGMLDPEREGIVLLASAGYRSDFVEQFEGGVVPLNKGIVGRVMASGKAELVADVSKDPDYLPTSTTNMVSQLTTPILRANKPIGVLVLESDLAGLLTEQDLEFASRLTEHAAVAIENARLFQEVEEANRAKTEFVSFVSHELKTPMTSIKGYTDLLVSGQMGEITDTQRQFLNTIRTNVERMARLVSDLADVSRIEAGHLRLEMDAISFRAVVEETLRSTQAQIEEKGQILHVEVPSGLPNIHADHTRMVQVLTNLVSNAHKYTPEGGHITICAQLADGERQGGMLHVSVQDTGIGMSAEELEQAFTKFFRTNVAREMAPGTGLGLNITKNLVQLHGGEIWAKSQPGEGTTFHFTVPVASEDSSSG